MRVAGIGFRKAAGVASLRAALDAAEAAGGAVQMLASLTDKAGAAPLRALAAERGLPLRGVDVDGQATATQSARVAARFGTGSVAEAAALVAAGPGARLVVARVTAPDGMATAAIAEGGGTIEGRTDA
jgi:cobalt-precorrin 5A hydrolase